MCKNIESGWDSGRRCKDTSQLREDTLPLLKQDQEKEGKNGYKCMHMFARGSKNHTTEMIFQQRVNTT